MKLQTLINKARTNKSQASKTTLKDNGLTFVLKYAPNAQGYNGEFEGNTFYAYIGFSKDDMELVGDVYVKDNGVIAMWSDKQAAYTEGLQEIIDIERLHFGDAIAADEEEEGAEVAPQPQSVEHNVQTVQVYYIKNENGRVFYTNTNELEFCREVNDYLGKDFAAYPYYDDVQRMAACFGYEVGIKEIEVDFNNDAKQSSPMKEQHQAHQSDNFDNETVRELLKEMHSLNKKIEVAEFNGRGSKGNQKKRTKVIREIAVNIGIDADELVQELSY